MGATGTGTGEPPDGGGDVKDPALSRDLDGIETGLGVLAGNYEVLRGAAVRGNDDGAGDERVLDLEYCRRLANYAAAAYAVLEDSQRFVTEHGDEAFYEHYAAEALQRGVIKRADFLHQLADSLRRRRPPVATAGAGERAEGLGPVMDREALGEWDGWEGDAAAYLEDRDGSVDLEAEVAGLQADLVEFYEWFFEYTRRYFGGQLSDRDRTASVPSAGEAADRPDGSALPPAVSLVQRDGSRVP